MSSITITVQSEEYETVNVELTEEEVRSLYLLRKENATKIADLQKNLDSANNSKKHAEDARDEAKNELIQAHTLLTALGVPSKTSEEEVYYRKDLMMTTRIALYIAAKN